MAQNKNKYYAVAVGRKSGIYDKWFGDDGAEAQVKGMSSARYKGFPTLAEAKAWLGNPTFSPAPKAAAKPAQTLKETDHRDALSKGTVILYTDGGCKNNPGPGGYGAVLLQGDKRKELSAAYTRTTNNRMELTACIEGLKALKYPCTVVLYTDSSYVVNGIEKGWAKRWRKNKWMRSAESPAENADLWDQLLTLCETHNVRFNWVRGHAGNAGNERCDTLANEAMAKKENVLSDVPFETGKTTRGGGIPSRGPLFD